MEKTKIHEAIADIAYIAGYMRYYSGDSRADMEDFIYWANQFEQLNENTDWEERDYMIEIEDYANKKINEQRKLQKDFKQ
jgi:hypothetical protein